MVELSNFQLRFTWTLHLQAGAWLNFAADHLDWHPGLAAYAAAKARVWASRVPTTGRCAADDPVVAASVADSRHPVPFTTGRAAPRASGWRPGGPVPGPGL